MLRVFEAFAGVGSQRMALRNIGIDFEVVGISDVDRYALLAYDAIHHNGEYVEEKTEEEMLEEFRKRNIAYNFSTGKSELPKKDEDIKKLYEAHVRSKNFGDIRTIDVNELPEIDLFTYSFPCKNISVAGKQDGFEVKSDTQSSLVWECRKIIEKAKPKYLLMENVKNIIGKNFKGIFDTWLSYLESLGYTNYYQVLNAKDFGLAQNRERVMMVSILGDHKPYKFTTSLNDTSSTIDSVLEDNIDEKYYLDKQFYISSLKGFKVNKDNKTIEYLGRELKVPCVCASRGRYIGNPNKRGLGLPTIQFLELNPYNVSNTLTTVLKDNYVIEFSSNKYSSIIIYSHNSDNNETITDFRVRKLTPLEYWRLIGFSDEDYYKAKDIGGLSESKLYERAGRGIAIPMLEEIFKNLFK